MALILGIDIGSRSVRGALLKTSLRTLETERYLEVPLMNLSVDSPPLTGVSAAISELLASLPNPPDAIITAIDGSRVSLRRVKIPEAARKRTQEVLPFELDPLLPFPVDEAIVDYQEVETRDGQLDLLAACVPESVIEEALEELASVGLYPRELAVGAAALDGLLATLSPPPDEAWLLLDVAQNHTDVCVVRNGACELARTLDQGLEAIRARPQSMKHSLNHTVMKYRSDGGPILSRVVVLGEATQDDNLPSWIASLVGVEGEALVLPPPRGSTSPASAVFGRAWALAARTSRKGKRLDLRRGRFAVARGASLLREHAVLVTVCAMALVGSYVFSVWAQYRVVSEERDSLAQQLEQVTEQHFRTPTSSPKRARELLEGGGQMAGPLPRYDAFRTLAAISAAIPEGVLHDTRKLEIQLDELGQTGTFQIDGKLPDLTARDQIADALESNECIQELERGKTSSAPGEDRKTYMLEGLVACPGSIRDGKGKAKAAKRGGRP